MVENRTPELQAAARTAVAHALGTGLISRPRYCSQCGCESDRIEGHHRDYAHPLVVEWLCPACHKGAHSTAPNAKPRGQTRCVLCRRAIWIHLFDKGRTRLIDGQMAHVHCRPSRQVAADTGRPAASTSQSPSTDHSDHTVP
jgi:hypothetical protein